MTLKDLIPWRAERTAAMPFPTDMNQLLADFWNGNRLSALEKAFVPNVEISESKAKITVSAELPGMSEDDIEVTLSPDNQHLTLKGEKKSEEEKSEDGFYHCERSYGFFRRTLPLPAEAKPDDIKAKFKNGVLKVTLQKADEASGSKRIKIES